MSAAGRCQSRTRTGTRCRSRAELGSGACATHTPPATATQVGLDRAAAQPAVVAGGVSDAPFLDEVLALVECDLSTPSQHPAQDNGQDHAGGGLMTDITGSENLDDWLIEELRAEGVDLGDELGDLRSTGHRLMQNSLASSTLDSYRRKFEPFERWCQSIGASALPARPGIVCSYILRLTHQGTAADPDPEQDSATEEGTLSVSTIAAVVAAIGAAHRNNGYAGEADPSQHVNVRNLIRGYGHAHTHGVRPAHAFSLEELGLMCDRCLLPASERSRDITLAVLASHPLLDLNGLRLQRLTWDMVALPSPDEPDATAHLHFGGRSGTVLVAAEPTDVEICPVDRLRRWKLLTGGNGPVFESPSKPGEPTSRAALVKRTHKLIATAGLEPSEVVGELPRLSVAHRRQLVRLLGEPSDIQLRDRALMAVTWWSGQRSEAISRLNVADLHYHESHTALRVHVRRSKNDQYGKGGTVALAKQRGYVGCPVEATTDWLGRYAATHGLTPTDDSDTPWLQQLIEALATEQLPLFPAINPTNRGERLGYHGINDIAKKYAALAGITETETRRISSHGFRAGSTTEMLAHGISAEEIARHQLRKDPQHIGRYNRPGDDLAATPTRNLANMPSHLDTPSGSPAARDPENEPRGSSK